MRNLVVVADGSPASDGCVRVAAEMARDADGALVVVGVLSGSLIDKKLTPPEAGRRRREAEDQARSALVDQLDRTAPDAVADVIAVFGDVAFDALLLASNLGADAVVASSTTRDLTELVRTSPMPVVVVPAG